MLKLVFAVRVPAWCRVLPLERGCHKALLTGANAAWNERNCLTDRLDSQMSALPHMARKILSGRSSLFPDSRNFRIHSFVGKQLNPRYNHNQRNREADSFVPFDART